MMATNQNAPISPPDQPPARILTQRADFDRDADKPDEREQPAGEQVVADDLAQQPDGIKRQRRVIVDDEASGLRIQARA
jgi:hypothetical protein